MDTDTPDQGGRFAQATRWIRDFGLGTSGYLIVLVVATAGWSASFIGLQDFAVHHMGLRPGPAWFVPTTFDGAALGLSVSVARAATHGRSAATWRMMIVAFTALSSWINWLHITDHTGRMVAALLPIAAVILFESLMGEARAAYYRRQPNTRVRPHIHPLRWVMDRSGTWAIMRAYVLGIPLPEGFAEAAEKVAEQAREQAEEASAKQSRRAPRKPAVTPQPAAAPPAERDVRVPDETPQEQTRPMLTAVRDGDERRDGDGLEGMTVAQLRELADRHGVAIRGSRAEIAERIRNAPSYRASVTDDGSERHGRHAQARHA